MPEVTRMHEIAKQRFEKIYTKINYANQGKEDVVVDPEYKQYVVRT